MKIREFTICTLMMVLANGCSLQVANSKSVKTTMTATHRSTTTQTATGTHTVTYTPTNPPIPTRIATITYDRSRNKITIQALLVNSGDIPDDDPNIGSLFTGRSASQRFTRPLESALCEVDCSTISWDDEIFITLYQRKDERESRDGMDQIETNLISTYKYLHIYDDTKIGEYMSRILPGYDGWAAQVWLSGGRSTEYFVTTDGPFIIYIRHKYICVDSCYTSYPFVEIHIAGYQARKLRSLLGP